jgi:hypothetical protein
VPSLKSAFIWAYVGVAPYKPVNRYLPHFHWLPLPLMLLPFISLTTGPRTLLYRHSLLLLSSYPS